RRRHEHPIRARNRSARPGPGRDHERAASADQPRLPAARLARRGGRRRARDLRPLVRHVAAATGSHRIARRLADDRRERYTGEWLPEPLPEPAEWTGGPPDGATADPADRVTLHESVGMAFLVV